MKLSEAVELYISMRDKKAQLKSDFDALVAPVQERMDKLELKLLEAFEKNGMDSVKTPAGTAYQTTRTSATIADRDVFMSHVKANLAWDLLEVRVNKSAVEAVQEETGELPPGVNLNTTRVVNVRRS